MRRNGGSRCAKSLMVPDERPCRRRMAMMPHDLPPWYTAYQQTHRWIAADVFEGMVHDLHVLLRVAVRVAEQPSAVILDGRTLQSTPESGQRAGFNGAKRKKGSKVHRSTSLKPSPMTQP